MREGVNKVILLGRIGRQPEMKGENNSILTFSVATPERYKDRDGNWQDKTEWHNVVVFGKRAEGLYSFLDKGMPVYIEGKNQTRSWEDREGGKRYTTEVIVRDIKVLQSKKDRQENGHDDRGGGDPGFDDADIPF